MSPSADQNDPGEIASPPIRRGKRGELDQSDPGEIAGRLLPLLKEYVERLRDVGKELQDFQARTAETRSNLVAAAKRMGMNERTVSVPGAEREFEPFRFAFHRISPAYTELARAASQLIAHGKLDLVTRLELSLRLADFEAELHRLQALIGIGIAG